LGNRDFWNGHFRMIQANLRKIDGKAINPEGLVDELLAMGANATVVNGAGTLCWYPSEHPYQIVNDELDIDFTGRFLREARKKGLKALVRMDIHGTPKGLLDKYSGYEEQFSDRFRRGPSGEIYKNAGTISACPTGWYWKEYNFQIIEEVIRKYGEVDGFFYNGFVHGVCYCERCKNLFRETSGLEIPSKEDWKDSAWQQFVQYRYNLMIQMASRIREFIHERSPDSIYICNTHLTDDVTSKMREYGWYSPAFSKQQDMLMVEAFNLITRRQPRWIYWAGEEAKLGRHIHNTCILLSHFQMFTSRRSAQPPIQLEHDIMQIAANGGSTWINISGLPGIQDDRKAMEGIKRSFAFLKENEDEYKQMQPYAQVALIYSQRTADFYGKNDPSDRWQAHYRGMYEVLSESHIPFTVIHEGSLPDVDLSSYSCVILPNIAILSDQEAAIIDQYVEKGGQLIATYETGLYDEFGNFRQEGQILKSIRRKVTGVINISGYRVHEKGGQRDDQSDGNPFGESEEHYPGGYLWIHNKELLKDFNETDLIPLGEQLLVTESVDPAETMVEDLSIITIDHIGTEYSYWDEPGKQRGLFNYRFGQGSVTYLPWRVDKLYHLLGAIEFKKVLVSVIDRAVGERKVVTDAPGTVEMTIAQRPCGGYLLHLLNSSGIQGKPLTELIHIQDINLSLQGSFNHARSLRTGRTYPVEQAFGYTRINIASLEIFEAIVFE
jgi:hypothetical protein